jgi:hypothetical protein
MPKEEAPHSHQEDVIVIIAGMDFCAPPQAIPARWERHPTVFDAAPRAFGLQAKNSRVYT